MSDVFDVRRDIPAIRKANAAYIASLMEDLLPAVQKAARGCGYAIAVHGTLARDIDLIAIPWTVQADSSDCFLERFLGAVASVTGRAHKLNSWSDKPHGRKSITIIGAMEPEIDLSIMPRIEEE